MNHAERVAFAAALALCAAACGGEDTPKPDPVEPIRHPVEIGPGEIGTVVGSGERGTDLVDADADGEVDSAIPVLAAHLDTPMDVAISPDGTLYVLDWNGHKVRYVDGENLAFFAGTGIEGDACEAELASGKCPALATELNHPTDITFAEDGSMWISAWHNSKIKRLDPAMSMVENVCGTGGRKYEGDGGQCRDAAGVDIVSFDLPSSVVLDAHGNLFIADQANQVIRRLGVDGIIKTVAGACPGTTGFGCGAGRGYDGDGGPATLAHLNNSLGQGTDPQGKIALDAEGNLYIADTGNDVIRKVTPGPDGILGDGDPALELISTIAGTGSPGYGGDGGPATEAMLKAPTDVDVDASGNVYIADRANSCVRRVAPDGVITTLAGHCGSPGFSGEGELATEAALWDPYGVEFDGNGALYIADSRNHCIRKVLLPE